MGKKVYLGNMGLALLAVFALIYAATPVFAIQHGNLIVYVTDCQCGNPIQNAYVSVSGEEFRSSYTDAGGHTYFEHLLLIPGPREDYLVVASKEGYHTAQSVATILCSQTVRIHICMNKKIVCGVDVRDVEAQNNQIQATIKNTGNDREEITVNFYVDSQQIGTKKIALEAGESRELSYLHAFDCGTHNVKVEAISNCGSKDEGYAVYEKNCYCQLSVNVYDENYNSLDADIYVDGAYRKYSNYLKETIEPGVHIISGKREGYLSDSETITCGENETANVELVLRKQTCNIKVHVHNLGEEPISGALVKMDSEKKLTNSNGIVIFRDVSPGTYYVSAEKTGYEKDSGRVECESGETEDVYLYLKSTRKSLKVHVKDYKTKELIEGARVEIINSDVKKEKETNEFGYAFFDNLVSGKYEVSVLAEGYSSNYKNIYVSEDLTTTDIYLKKKNTEVSIKDLEISPSTVCMDEDENIDISLPITLKEGNDVEFEVKFYIREGEEWVYLGKDVETLNEDEKEEFEIEYKYEENTLAEGNYKIKAEIEYNDEEETEYAYLRVKNCCNERAKFKIDEITLDPSNPKIGDMVIGTVPVELIEGYNVNARLEAMVDGQLKNSENIWFGYAGQSKLFEFAFDTSDYGIGYHTVKIFVKTGSKTQEAEKEFYVSNERRDSDFVEYKREHCLRINEIKELNSPLKSGEKTELAVEIENCGDYMERNINTKLKDSDVMLGSPFNLRPGEEKKIIFRFYANKTENLTINVWNSYNSVSRIYELKVYSGRLSIHLKPEYIVYADEDNKIRFSVRNLGKVEDEFEIQTSENVMDWVFGLPEKIELKPGESKTMEITVNPNVVPGEYNFEIIAKTANSETTASSKFRVVERWKVPTGLFMFAGILPWILLIILILVLAFLLCLFGKNLYKRMGDRKRENIENMGEETATAGKKKTKFWWDDC